MSEIIKHFRKMSNVDRLAGKYKLRNYSIAIHQYYTALLFIHFAKLENIKFDYLILDLILKHDVLEVITNDLPWTCKNLTKKTKKYWSIIEKEVLEKNSHLKDYSDENIKALMNEKQHALFKACDYLDLFLFIYEERNLGNKDSELKEVAEKCVELIGDQFQSIKSFIKNYTNK